mgnify:CR=1 FL=1
MILPTPKVVAEVSCTHLGQMDRAKKLINLAKICNAPYVKFQKRNPDESTPEHLKKMPHPNKMFAYGDTYLAHRKALELSIDQHKELQEYCKSIEIEYATSVWDITSAKEIIKLDPKFIKVPSACNANYDLIKLILNEFGGDLHISSGMSTPKEVDALLDFLEPWSYRVVFYHCTSEYPCDFENLFLLEIERLRHDMPERMRLGFSNHGRGIATDIAAYVLGAEWIERHFIDDRLVRHTDSAASLEPGGLSKLVRDLNAIYTSAKYKSSMTNGEAEQRKKLRVN